MEIKSIIQVFWSKFGELEKTLDGQEPMWVAYNMTCGLRFLMWKQSVTKWKN
jgi:hypothetical protein